MRILLLLLFLAVISPLAGCSSNDDSEQQRSEPAVQTEQPAKEQAPAAALEQSVPQEQAESPSEASEIVTAEQSSPEQDAQTEAPAAEDGEIITEAPAQEQTAQQQAAPSTPEQSVVTTESSESTTSTTQDGNATASIEESVTVEEQAEAPKKPAFEALPGFAPPETLTADTAKSPNYPATPQVPETEVSVESSFGVEQLRLAEKTPEQEASKKTTPEEAKKVRAEEKKPVKLSSSFGIETPKPAPEQEEEDAAAKQAAQEAQQAAEEAQLAAERAKLEKAREEARKREAAKEKAKRAAQAPKKKLFARTANIHEKNVEFLPTTAEGPDMGKLQEAKEKFKNFASNFIDKINRSYLHTPGNPEIVKENGKYKARYTELDKISVALKIKQSKYEHTPFVGFMKYSEKIYEAQGDSPEAAVNGSYRVKKSTNVTEIFRYAKGAWIE